MKNPGDELFFKAYYREPGPLDRKACDHQLFEMPKEAARRTGFQFARIAEYLFGLTSTGLEKFKCFFDDPDELAAKYGWNKELIAELKSDAGWAGERLSYSHAIARMKEFADSVIDYPDGSILFLFSRDKVDFNVEVYSTPDLDFIEGFIIASIDSGDYLDFISIIINEVNIVEIEGDYGLNPPPDDNPWRIIYDGEKLAFANQSIYPQELKQL